MSVEFELGLGPDMESVVVTAWDGWTVRRPELAAVEDPCRLRAWLQQADPKVADEVAYGLAWLASVEGGDDIAAAKALAWLVLPAASFVARQLRTLASGIDHAVAAELWIQVRTFPLHRRKVIGNLVRELRNRVLEACEAPRALQRTDRTWFATTGCSMDTPAVLSLVSDQTPTAWEELLDVLEWAEEERVIRPSDRRLLLCLVQAVGIDARVGAGLGLLANEAVGLVARHLGVSERTVRRRARICLQALTAAALSYVRVA